VGSYTDSFTYTATDGHGDVSNTGTVSVTLNVAAETVTAADVDGGTVDEDSVPAISVVAAVGKDADDVIDHYSASAASALGATIIDNHDGTFSYDASTVT